MKILHITESFASGTYIYLKNLSEFLVKNNQEVYIIYSDKRENFNMDSVKNDFDKSINFIKIDLDKEINIINDVKISIKISKVIKDINPDVIHLHSSKASIIGRWASFLSFHKHKLFYTPHGYSFLRQDISKTKQLLFKNIEKYTQKIFGGTTIACGDTEYEIAKTLGKSELVRNGISSDKVSTFYKPNTNKKLTIGIVARITYARNPSLFNKIALKFPQYDFIWIGDGELREELTAKNIKVSGWVSNQEKIYQMINNLDIVLQTSLWEGLPIALLESSALKKPIIATNIIGNKDIITHNYNGFLFTNIDEIEPYFTALKDDQFRLEMGNNSLKVCKEKFDNKINLEGLLKIYLK